jgi:hypothetical protein
MRAILHIGTEKTGSTSIQVYLYKNRRKLRRAGYHVLQCAGKYASRAIPAACIADNKPDEYLRDLGINTPQERQAHRDGLSQSITRELAELPASVHTVLISSEHFHSRIQTEEEMDNVHRLLSPFFDEFKIICYLREQVVTCSSWYSTALKGGGTKSFSDFMKMCRPQRHYFNYYKMLASWERRFGFEALDVGLFSRGAFLNGDLLDDFTQRIDPKLTGSLDKAIEVENQSLTPVGQALARAVNLTFPVNAPNPESAQMRDKCKKFINATFTGVGQFPSLETQRNLYESFLESNEQVRQKFFPGVETLFQPPAKVTPLGDELGDSFVTNFYFLLGLLKDELGAAVHAHDILRFCEVTATCINDLDQSGQESSGKAAGTAILNDDVARMLRDSAIKLEQVDIAQAVPLMELAKRINPSLRQVDQRLDKYQRLLQQEARPRFMIAFSAKRLLEDLQEQQTLTRKFVNWQSQLSTPAQMHMPPSSRSVVVEPDGTVCDEGEDSATLYLIIEADSMEDAVEVAKKCPALEVGGNVRVSQLASMKKKK